MTKDEFLACLCPVGRELTEIREQIKVRHAGSASLAGRLNLVANSMRAHLASCATCTTAMNRLAASRN